MLLTRQECSGSDIADIPILLIKRQRRSSCLQLQTQAKLVTASIDILPIHQCREEKFHT